MGNIQTMWIKLYGILGKKVDPAIKIQNTLGNIRRICGTPESALSVFINP
jgi:hypothetical protein